MRIKRHTHLYNILLLSCFVAQPLVAKSVQAEIILSETCLPGFALTDGNRCEFKNLYRLYESLQGFGVGGLKSGLPDLREGFSPQQIDLGRYLFFDPILSGDSSLSCASCHHPDTGFSDGLGRSQGISGSRANRSAPTLWNVGFLKSLFWDGRATTLEEQIQGPLYSEVEMGSSPEQLLMSLNGKPEYLSLFKLAFPNDGESITLAKIYTAITAFEASLISLNSRYDQYAHGYSEALTANEFEGLNVFRSFVARCGECHTPPLFTNQQIAVLGTPEPEGMLFDAGRGAITGVETNRGGFSA